ncbi:MAG: histidine triad nucleotide-binding protein [Bacillota bacterium]|uniref:HIT domain-containing protein n=1 Tax=Thermanaerosceptrum fracticalcis TaxID=1712410 RepID=A0A7G6E251_THEFR|nr:histidine triad nucleotide-binding protein [Thermanaerosceptrum fracticalcis]MBZ4653876.1 histidine triad nucleotide-binding protein [Peptococcaceae bacterium]QNB46155.1 HIT domain-containing protein [Thermanaerosceptrum fracticalcis]
MSDCIFCKIAEGTIPSKKVYEDEKVLAFHDINPVAPVHVLVIPKKHITSLATMEKEDQGLIGHIFGVIHNLAEELKLQKGYRVVNNCGEEGGQTVAHLHFHLLGGRSFAWPPG